MDILNSYLDSLIFTRVEEKGGYAIYGAGISGMIGGGKQRYILLFVPSHLAISSKEKARNLPWKNMQTRTLMYSYKLRKQNWKPSRDLTDFELNVVHRTDKFSEYRSQGFPFEVLMLHDPKRKTKFQYHNRLSLYSVIESFNSVFNYIGETPPITLTKGPTVLPPLVNNDLLQGRMNNNPFGFDWKFQNNNVNDNFELL